MAHFSKSAWLCRFMVIFLATTPGLLLARPIGPVRMAPLAAKADTSAQIMTLAERVADYQMASMAAGFIPPKAAADTYDPKGWVQAALFIGLTELAERSDKDRYRQLILQRGMANHWEPGKRLYHADDHAIGQAYVWAARHGAGDAAIAPLRKSFDAILAQPSRADLDFVERPAGGGAPLCQDRWCWCDALFMSPAAFLEMSKLTGDPRYAEFARAEFRATTGYLYDPVEHLYYRDSRFFDRRGPNGEKVFWSRGNGWVFAGLARMIQRLPEGDSGRAYMEGIFRAMAARLIKIQKPDGYWSPSLLSDPKGVPPESSGTGFYVYGLAWGVKAGLLPRAEYEPAVNKGWMALTQAVHPDGMLGWVQPISDRPDQVDYDNTQYYGVGAFLLAATAVSDLRQPAPKSGK